MEVKSQKSKIKNQKYDQFNMRRVILDFPKQFRVGLKAAKDVGRLEDVRRPNAVLICGMGGSALPADILAIWLKTHQIKLPFYIHRNYGLPATADKNHLIICISYSGNTEETLSAFETALREEYKIAAITSGGKLARLCQKYKIPAAIVPAGLQPRMALGLQFAALMGILENCGLIQNNLGDISVLEKSLNPKTLEARGRKLAKKLKGKIPLIYASDNLKALARIWKIKFNENSKVPAFSNYLPELNHSELDGFNNSKQLQSLFYLLILQDPADHPRILKRMELTAKILKKRGVKVDIIEILGKDILYKVFSTTLLGDWLSYYLALEYKTDPTPTKINEEFKAGMAN